MTKPTEIARTDNVQFVAPITSAISTVSFHRLRLATPDGEPASLAMIDMQGRNIDSGANVTRAVRDDAIRSCRCFLIGSEYLRG